MDCGLSWLTSGLTAKISAAADIARGSTRRKIASGTLIHLSRDSEGEEDSQPRPSEEAVCAGKHRSSAASGGDEHQPRPASAGSDEEGLKPDIANDVEGLKPDIANDVEGLKPRTASCSCNNEPESDSGAAKRISVEIESARIAGECSEEPNSKRQCVRNPADESHIEIEQERTRALRVLMDPTATHYDVLDLPSSCTLDDARGAHRKLVRLLNGTDHVARINAAYQIVGKCADARKKYDASLKMSDPLSYFPGDAKAAQFVQNLARPDARPAVIPFLAWRVPEMLAQSHGGSELDNVEAQSGCRCYLPACDPDAQSTANGIVRMMLIGTALQREKCKRILERGLKYGVTVDDVLDYAALNKALAAPKTAPAAYSLMRDWRKNVAYRPEELLQVIVEDECADSLKPHTVLDVLLSIRRVHLQMRKDEKLTTPEWSTEHLDTLLRRAADMIRDYEEQAGVVSVCERLLRVLSCSPLSTIRPDAWDEAMSAAIGRLKLEVLMRGAVRNRFPEFATVAIFVSSMPKKLGSAPWVKSWKLLFTAIALASKLLLAVDRNSSIDSGDLWDCEPLTKLAEACQNAMRFDDSIAGLPGVCALLCIRIGHVLPRYNAKRTRTYVLRAQRSFAYEKMLSASRRHAFNLVICRVIQRMPPWPVNQVAEVVDMLILAADGRSLRNIIDILDRDGTVADLLELRPAAELNNLVTCLLSAATWEKAPTALFSSRCGLPLLNKILSTVIVSEYLSCAPATLVLDLAYLVRVEQRVYLPLRAAAVLAVRFANELVDLRDRDALWTRVGDILQVFGPALLRCPKLALAIVDTITHYLPQARKRPREILDTIIAHVDEIQHATPVDPWPLDVGLSEVRAEFGRICQMDHLRSMTVSDVDALLQKRYSAELAALGPTPINTITMLSPDFRVVDCEIWYRPYQPILEQWNSLHQFLHSDYNWPLHPVPPVTTRRKVFQVKLTGGSSQSEYQMRSIRGCYVVTPIFQHGAKVLEHEEDAQLPAEKRRTMYYDSGDVSESGWWVGQGLASNEVWAFSAGKADESAMPPVGKWPVPWEGEIDPSVTVVYDLCGDRPKRD